MTKVHMQHLGKMKKYIFHQKNMRFGKDIMTMKIHLSQTKVY